MNRQGLWFLTLFSLILVLSVYYITMPNDMFRNSSVDVKEDTDNVSTSSVNSQNTSYIETLKVELDSERSEIINTLQSVLNDKNKSSDEKNKAYEQMKEINSIKASESNIEKKIKEEFNLNAYVKQDNSKIEIVVEGKDHDVKLANKIMRTVQSLFDDGMNISVKFS